MDENAMCRSHFVEDDIPKVNPAFEGQDFEQGQHGSTYVVKVKPTWIHPHSGDIQSWFQAVFFDRKIHFCDKDICTKSAHTFGSFGDSVIIAS